MPLLDSSVFFGRPGDPSVRDVEATVSFPHIVFIFAVCCTVGLSFMSTEGLGAAEASPAKKSRAVAGRASGPATVATLFVRPVTLWFAVFVGILGLVAVQRSVPEPGSMYQRNV